MPIPESIASWLFKAYKESPRLVTVLSIITGGLLFLPSRTLAVLSLDSFAQRNREWISLVFLFCFLITLSHPVASLWGWMKIGLRERKLHKWGIARLHQMDSREREFLRRLCTENRRTAYVDAFDPVVLSLIRNNIVTWPTRTIPTHRAPALVSEWAWDYLKKHPELLKEQQA